MPRCAEEPWELSYALGNEAETDRMVGGMWDVKRALKADGAGVGKQQTSKAYWRRGLGPGGKLEG